MKVLSRALQDASLQLTALAVLALVFLVTRGTTPPTVQGRAAGHPATCHACASIPPGETSRFEKYLLAHGYVDRPGEGE